jgi:hypothetical protein
VADLQDFSSFDKDVERTFVPFERNMRDNEKRAFTLGFGLAGAVFVLASLVVIFGYTPCSNFCERPPGSCKDPASIEKWKAGCEGACRDLEHASGLQIIREKKDEASGKMEQRTDTVGGTEYVQMLNACAFSGGGGLTCEGIVENATKRGLWCPEDKK